MVELLRLAGPTVAQMASYTVMQFADTMPMRSLRRRRNARCQRSLRDPAKINAVTSAKPKITIAF